MYKYKRIKLKDGTTRDEHRLVMEAALGRRLRSDEDVHHINGDPRDNRIENLELMDRKTHARLHLVTDRRCSIVECDRKHWGKGYCKKHYRRWLQTGDVMGLRGRSSSNPMCIP